MPNKDVFCSSPWYELHIYWDGSLGFCCQEYHKAYPESESSIYNVQNMSIREWVDSEPMRKARMSMFGDSKNSICRRCYHEEDLGASSRRHRCNQKSVIFTRTAFQESYQQSPGYQKFQKSRHNDGAHDRMPIDLHIDLGNYCNLACKMCNPRASSMIAAQYVKWGDSSAARYIGTDWTRNQEVWERVTGELASIEDLNNVHFMGGETLITRRFEEFIDCMIEKNRTDLCVSFVTNGTTFNQSLLDKLKRFRRVGIEVSIESMDQRNSYQRQGTDQSRVLENIKRYLSQCNGTSITVTMRPAISALTIGSYHTLLDFCMEHNLVVKSLFVVRPGYLDPVILPADVKLAYLEKYRELIDRHELGDIDCGVDYNESDPNQIKKIVKNQINGCMQILAVPTPADSEARLQELVSWCKKWDAVYGYNALEIYPELKEVFLAHGYSL